MMFNIIHSEEDWTPQMRLRAGLARGRKPGRLPGGHVIDLADLKKAIVLCGDCKPKFNAARAEYITKVNLPFVQGRCDGCDRFTPRGHLLVHHTIARMA